MNLKTEFYLGRNLSRLSLSSNVCSGDVVGDLFGVSVDTVVKKTHQVVTALATLDPMNIKEQDMVRTCALSN